MAVASTSRRVLLWEWTQAALLAANLVWTTLCLGGYLAKTMVVTSLLTAALLFVHAVGAWALAESKDAGMGVAGSREPKTPAAGAVHENLRYPHPAGFWFIPFLIYAAANVLWTTPVRWLGWFDWLGWAQMVAVFWVVLNGIRSRTVLNAIWGVLITLAVVAVLIACYQRFVRPDWLMLGRVQPSQYAGRASGPFGIPNSLAALLLLLLPVTGALTFRRRANAVARVFFGWLTVILIFGLGLTISRGAWLSLAIVLTAWPLLGLRVSWGRRFVIAGAVLGGIVAAGAATYAASPTVRERFVQLAQEVGERSRPILWRAAWKIFRSQPVQGSGAGSYDVLFEKHRPEGFIHQPIWAHNDYLNTLSDYGVLGFVLFFGAAAVVIVRRTIQPRELVDGTERTALETSRFTDGRWLRQEAVRTRERSAFDDPLVRQAIAVGLAAFALQLFVDFHFKIPALAMVFAAIAGLAVGQTWQYDRQPSGIARKGVWIVPVTLMAAAAAIMQWVLPAYRGEALRDQARGAINRLVEQAATSDRYRDEIATAKTELARAVALAPTNGQAWADHAYALAQWSRVMPKEVAELGREAEADANRAIRLSPVMAEFWIRRGVARDMQGRRLDAATDFTHAISLSPKAPFVWYYYAYHLSLESKDRDMALAMADFCLRLDPKNPEAVRLRQQLAVSQVQP